MVQSKQTSVSAVIPVVVLGFAGKPLRIVFSDVALKATRSDNWVATE